MWYLVSERVKRIGSYLLNLFFSSPHWWAVKAWYTEQYIALFVYGFVDFPLFTFFWNLAEHIIDEPVLHVSDMTMSKRFRIDAAGFKGLSTSQLSRVTDVAEVLRESYVLSKAPSNEVDGKVLVDGIDYDGCYVLSIDNAATKPDPMS